MQQPMAAQPVADAYCLASIILPTVNSARSNLQQPARENPLQGLEVHLQHAARTCRDHRGASPAYTALACTSQWRASSSRHVSLKGSLPSRTDWGRGVPGSVGGCFSVTW